MLKNIKNEQGVIVLFAQQAEAAGFEIVGIRTEFPDAIVCKDGIEYRAEFEYQSSNFRTHKHDIRKCDIIICWEQDSDSILPILALSETGWERTSIDLPSDGEREIEYWKQRALLAEETLKRNSNKAMQLSHDNNGQMKRQDRLNDIRGINAGRDGDGPMSAEQIAARYGVSLRQAQRDVAAVAGTTDNDVTEAH